MTNLLNIHDLNKEILSKIVERAIVFSSKEHFNTLKNKRITLLFSEVSLRTKISFEIAAQLLGGIAVSISIPDFTKEFDGTPREDFLDIIKSLEGWSDSFVIRDYTKKYLDLTLKVSKLPIIDGFCGLDHPTQTIADLAIIRKELGKIEGIEICCICPEFGSGIMESFAYGALLMGATINFLVPNGDYSPKNKSFFKIIQNITKNSSGKLNITPDKKQALEKADILYVDEWWQNNPDFLKINLGKLKVDKSFLENAPKNIRIMHYLPAHHEREITKEVLHSNKSIAFKQTEFRLCSAMASLEYIFGLIK